VEVLTGSRGRLVACVAVSLMVMPATALAAAGGPEAVKKNAQDPTATTPTATPTPVDTTKQNTNGSAGANNVNSNAKTPVNQGTVKKLATSPTQTSPTTTTPATRTTRTVVRRRSAATRRATSSTTSHHAAARRAAARQARGTTANATQAPAATVSPPAATPASRAARQRARHKAAVAAKHKHKEAPVTGFASINRAADRVIEVIPGVVVLALAGLIALVLVLMLRSYMMERRRAAALSESYGVTVQALATAIEAKDHTTGGHIERVRELGLLLARQLAPRDARDPQMAYGFLLHDIGKLAIPDAILRKPGRLSEQEWALMRRHPENGANMLAEIPFLDRALDVVRHHHERWDGGGYPDGLARTDIPLWARIFAVVDALDAMTADRPYRTRQSYEVALTEIKNNAGTQFDPAVVTALEALDTAEVERLLEPAQVLDRFGGGDVPELEPLEAILAASESARVQAGDVAPAPRNGNGNGASRTELSVG
jgi:HD-GYP domain-containing protein (c-di-GMP phosphodiesterase class II)